mmetsp:Transcript_3232/g.4639  ORF Transcript_3232/g.4639 Transcript_3232/m.4639 type:complete len:215 (+) Transcript_3232:305-949(+)
MPKLRRVNPQLLYWRTGQDMFTLELLDSVSACSLLTTRNSVGAATPISAYSLISFVNLFNPCFSRLSSLQRSRSPQICLKIDSVASLTCCRARLLSSLSFSILALTWPCALTFLYSKGGKAWIFVALLLSRIFSLPEPGMKTDSGLPFADFGPPGRRVVLLDLEALRGAALRLLLLPTPARSTEADLPPRMGFSQGIHIANRFSSSSCFFSSFA